MTTFYQKKKKKSNDYYLRKKLNKSLVRFIVGASKKIHYMFPVALQQDQKLEYLAKQILLRHIGVMKNIASLKNTN
jgi:hypothetical protein